LTDNAAAGAVTVEPDRLAAAAAWVTAGAEFFVSPLGIVVLAVATLVGGIAVLRDWGGALLGQIVWAGRWIKRVLVGRPRLGNFGVPPGRRVIGREAEAKAIAALLRSGKRVVLSGQGGVGKSTLARHVVETHGKAYDGVLWTGAATRQALIEGLCGLCAPLGLAMPEIAAEAHAKAVLARAQQAGRRWLFVYDNVESRGAIEGLIPEGAPLLMTTRAAGTWAGFEMRRTEALDCARPDSPAVALLMEAAARRDNAAGARALAADLGGLPLGLVVMGALVRRHGGAWADWQGRLDEAVAHAPQDEGYPTSILGAVTLSYDRLTEDARRVADLCAWWAPDGLGADLLTEAPSGDSWAGLLPVIAEPIAALARDAARVRAAFGALADASLIAGEGGVYAMHRMTATALRALPGAAAAAPVAAALLAAVYPGGTRSVNASANWPLCKQLTPHVRALLATGQAPRIPAMHYLLNQASIYLGVIGDDAGALETAHGANAMAQQSLPPSHSYISLGLIQLGDALARAGDLVEAEAKLAEGVALDEAYRPGSAELANSYQKHGDALLQRALRGDVVRLLPALRRCQQALALNQRLFGRRAEPVALSLSGLGSVRRAQGRGAAAARLSAAALRRYRRTLPPGDARLAAPTINTGSNWLEAGAADRAEPLLREALGILETVLADQPMHAQRRSAAGWLIACLLVRAGAGEDQRGREAEARALCKRYGFDVAKAKAIARRFPYTPGA
jgi:tetratricopeptide (TPR) repeat protein